MEQAYEQIKRRIITLDLPPGERIDDYQLSEELSLSRTPVREALFVLAAEGLVATGGGAGFVVRALDVVNITSLFEAHIVLAKAVARLAGHRATREDVRGMSKAARAVETAIRRRDFLAITSANATLHRLEAAAAHSQHLEAMAKAVHDQGQRLAYLCFGGGGREWGGLDEHFEKVQQQHAALLTAYRDRDSRAAEAMATAHVNLFRERVRGYLASSTLDDLTFSDSELGEPIVAAATGTG